MVAIDRSLLTFGSGFSSIKLHVLMGWIFAPMPTDPRRVAFGSFPAAVEEEESLARHAGVKQGEVICHLMYADFPEQRLYL